jgi:hypothetical protein
MSTMVVVVVLMLRFVWVADTGIDVGILGERLVLVLDPEDMLSRAKRLCGMSLASGGIYHYEHGDGRYRPEDNECNH